jgi:hypothetical protein
MIFVKSNAVQNTETNRRPVKEVEVLQDNSASANNSFTL